MTDGCPNSIYVHVGMGEGLEVKRIYERPAPKPQTVPLTRAEAVAKLAHRYGRPQDWTPTTTMTVEEALGVVAEMEQANFEYHVRYLMDSSRESWNWSYSEPDIPFESPIAFTYDGKTFGVEYHHSAYFDEEETRIDTLEEWEKKKMEQEADDAG